LPVHAAAAMVRTCMTCVLTLVAARHATTLAANLIAQVQDMTGGGAVTMLSPGEAADIACARVPDLDQIRAVFAGAPIDVIATPADGRRKRILIADMDSTIVTGETLDELAAGIGLGEKVAAITARAMNGELDFKDALRERVAMLKGVNVAVLERTWQGIRLTHGALELVATMKAHGAFTALISGGFSFFTSRVAALAGFDMHRSNTLLGDGTTLSGRVAEPILDRSAKLATLREVTEQQGLPLSAALATGDGANDLDMLQAAGLGVAFHAKPIVAAATKARVDHADLRALLFAQGYPANAFAAVG
jgi:phosphoserine phosphatase